MPSDSESLSSSSSSEDEDSEILNDGLPWQYHPLRKFLLDLLVNDKIPVEWRKMGPFDVWNTYCDHNVFKGMEYDAAFRRRLLALRKQVGEGRDRAAEDLMAFNIAKANYPPPERNHRNEPQWNGSEAQRLLEMDMNNKLHFDLKPHDLWESRQEYQEFHLETFRDHIHSADRTRKYLETLKSRDELKQRKREEKAARKIAAKKKAAANLKREQSKRKAAK